MKKFYIFIIVIALFLNFSFSVSAEGTEAVKAENYSSSEITGVLKDGKVSTHSSLESFSYSGNGVKYIYIVFWDSPCAFTVSSNGKSESFNEPFLHYCAELSEVSGNFKVSFEKPVEISEISFWGEGSLPNEVQAWKNNGSFADLLLFSTHADDEQLFFAGILPYYATEKGYRVQVVYFTDHKNEPNRRHELLDGLWKVGVTRYPVISDFPDMWSESYEGALSNLGKSGFSEEDVYAFQVKMLRRFKPLVLVEHDLGGEYKHGQHILNSNCMIKSVEYAADSSKYPDSLGEFGAWDTPKMYVHLYGENAITVDFIDTPSEKLGNKTPFQITQEGFKCHGSQQGTWFKPWLFGKNGQITSASQIDKYSPLNFGLYRSKVGNDVLKNDFFENLTSYDEQERLAEEKAKEEERLKQLEEQQKAKEQQKEEEKENGKVLLIVLSVILVLIVALVFVLIKIKKKH